MTSSRFPELSLVAAVARNRVIGHGNRLPWHLPDDLKRFKQITLGNVIVMGRKTFDSIGRPLPGRENVVITRDASLVIPGVRTVPSLSAAVEVAAGRPVFVIGGGEIYSLALPLATRLYLTEVDTDVEGDAWFPEFDRSEWREVAREPGQAGGALAYAFVTYTRNP